MREEAKHSKRVGSNALSIAKKAGVCFWEIASPGIVSESTAITLIMPHYNAGTEQILENIHLSAI